MASDFHFVDTTRAGFKLTMDISAYSLIALARGAAPLMEKRGGGSVLTLTYLGSERVFNNYNAMAVAKAPRKAPASHHEVALGPGIRVSDLGRYQDAAASGISGFSNILQHYRDRAPMWTVDTVEVAKARVSADAADRLCRPRAHGGRRFHPTGM
jgi:enoyl-[acyl-carrier protein] reductase I